MSRFVYVNGRFLRRHEATIDIEDRGFNFGDAVYEVIFMTAGNLVDEEGHLDRLEYSLGELGIPMPKSRAAMSLLIRELVRMNGVTDGFVYLQVSRGAAPRDHQIPLGLTPSLVMMSRAIDLTTKPSVREGVAVVTVPDIRWARRDIKTTQLIANCLAKSEAVRAGAGEAWMIDEKGVITEGSTSNAWIVTTDGALLTRPPSNEILNGITRLSIIKLAEAEGVDFVERAFTLDESKAAAEAFFSSATSLATPVISIDGEKIGDGKVGPLTAKLQAQYIDFARRGVD